MTTDNDLIQKTFPSRPFFIGMIHLGPLPGAPRFGGDLGAVVEAAVTDARALVEGGADAILVENFHDAPFLKQGLAPETVASLTRCALAVRAAAPGLPLGINALRNDGLAALGVAVAACASFIRVNVLTGAVVTDQGVIEGDAAALLRRRAALRADVALLADVQVKHAAPLAALDPAQWARDTAYRGGADALVVSGSGTGEPTSPERVADVRRAVPDRPVLVGSGATAATIAALGADGYIVGTALKTGGRVDAAKVRAVAEAIRSR
jgi:membrane complex biogenesis BtpA family protein